MVERILFCLLSLLISLGCTQSKTNSPTVGSSLVKGKINLSGFSSTDITMTIESTSTGALGKLMSLMTLISKTPVSVSSNGTFEVYANHGEYIVEVVVPGKRKRKKKVHADDEIEDLGEITLAEERRFIMTATSGSTAVFAGGSNSGCVNSVEIYDATLESMQVISLPSNRGRGAATAIGSKVFVAGGEEATPGTNFPCTFSSTIDILDLSDNSWSLASLSVARMELSAITVGGKALFAGGLYSTGPFSAGSSSVVDIYNSTTDTWSTSALSVGRSGMTAVVDGSKAYFAGGATTAAGSTYSTAVDIYDSATGTWSAANLSLARRYLASAKVGTKIIFAGGQYDNAGTLSESDRVDIFDTSNSSWSQTTLSQPRQLLASAISGSKAFFAGGEQNGHESATVDIYNASTNTWSTLSLSIARSNLSGLTLSNKAVFAGGNYFPTGFSNVLDIFDSSLGTWLADEM